mmetsp:Transcript_47875/g.120692  ORF Transcript_47875/g.120692 Transcript_47875/m.120692 type:complete len:207 (+) Transcript_47875:1203-1823(+)
MRYGTKSLSKANPRDVATNPLKSTGRPNPRALSPPRSPVVAHRTKPMPPPDGPARRRPTATKAAMAPLVPRHRRRMMATAQARARWCCGVRGGEGWPANSPAAAAPAGPRACWRRRCRCSGNRRHKPRRHLQPRPLTTTKALAWLVAPLFVVLRATVRTVEATPPWAPEGMAAPQVRRQSRAAARHRWRLQPHVATARAATVVAAT